MHNRFHIFNDQSIAIAAAAILMVAACSKDENYQQIPAPKQLPLTIEVTETPFVAPDNPVEAPGRRAAITTTSTLTSFTLNYGYGSTTPKSEITLSKNGQGKWTTSSSWPDVNGDVTVYWYAKTAGTFNWTDDENKYPYISFSVEDTPSNHKDLLVATASGTSNETDGKLTFNFEHACAALRFYVKKATNLDAYTLSVTEITLCNVKGEGNYYYGTSSWANVTTPESYVLYYGSAKTLGSADYVDLDASVYPEEPYLFIIPQKLAAWDGTTPIASTTDTYLRINCTIMDGDKLVYTGTAYIPFAVSLENGLEKGHQYDVKINIGKNSLYSGPNTKIITES